MSNTLNNDSPPWYYRKPLSEALKLRLKSNQQTKDSIAIIGGGIASAMLCYHLCRRGYKVSLYCQDEAVAQNASGNGQGAIYPLLNGGHDGLSQFYLQAFEYSLALFKQLEAEGHSVPFSQCGVTQLGFDAAAISKNENIIQRHLSSSILQSLSPVQTNELSGLALNMPAVHYPLGGWLDAAKLTGILFGSAMATGKLSTHFNQQLSALQQCDEHWQLQFKEDKERSHPVVLLACGHTIADFEQTRHIPLTPVRGQVSHIPSEGVLPKLKTVLCYKGYLTPNNAALSSGKSGSIHHLGASHKHDNRLMAFSIAEQQQNKQSLSQCLSAVEPLIDSVDVSAQQGRVAIRSASRDHLPFVGQVPDYDKTISAYQTESKGARSSKRQRGLPKVLAPGYDNLYMLAGLGSRGLCSAGLCSQILVSQLLDEAQESEPSVLNLLNPNRIWIRKLLKGRPV